MRLFTEISRATTQDVEDLAEASTAKHDVASVASYLDMLTERGSALPGYFLVDTERLEGRWAVPQLPVENDPRRPLSVVLKELMICLRGTSRNSIDLDFQLPDISDNGESQLDSTSTIRKQALHQHENAATDVAESQPRQSDVTPKEPGKDPLWSIADVLLNDVEKLVTDAIKDRTLAEVSESDPSRSKVDGLYACRTAENGVSVRNIMRCYRPLLIRGSTS